MSPSWGTGWLLTVEPLGASVAWSLLRNSGRLVTVDAGMIEDATDIKAVADALRPDPSAARNAHGRSGVWASQLTDPVAERAANSKLGSALLPQQLRLALLSGGGGLQTVTIAARGWLSALPWDVLGLAPDSDIRLVECALLFGGLSPVLGTSRAATSPNDAPGSPGLVVIDPGPRTGRPSLLYPGGHPEVVRSSAARASDTITPPDRCTTPQQLAHLLHQRPSRWLYLGHVRPAPADNPAAAALVLGEQSNPSLLTARDWLASPDNWPAPRRVALIGCASDDTSSFEQSGLVVASINAGAQVVTSTRWPLPGDHPRHLPLTSASPVHQEALSLLAVAVHTAHRQAGLAMSLRTWQLHQLESWRATGDARVSPLTWASTVTYRAPRPGEEYR